MAYWPFFPWKAMQKIIISTPLSFSTQPKIVKAATTFLNTLDILSPAAQMPTAAPGSRGPQILNYSSPPPPQYTDALGIPGFPCHFLPLPFPQPSNLGNHKSDTFTNATVCGPLIDICSFLCALVRPPGWTG